MKNATTSLALVFILLCLAGAEEFAGAEEDASISVLMKQGGWCWYQDPRVIIHGEKLLIGSVEGNGSGNAVVGVFDLKAKRPMGRTVVHEDFDRDDHNAPVFYARPDGSVLTVYTRHNRNKTHNYRISAVGDPLAWGEELAYRHDYPDASNVTYMNLFPMQKEGKLYNFFRGIQFNPSFITSTDHGTTWNEPTHFIQSELDGRHRPYARYAGNGTDTVHVCFTDGHPRDFGNSIYYAAFREGNFFRVDGTLIKNLKADGPLRPGEAELIYKGGGGPGRGGSLSALQSAWTSSIAIDSKGLPSIAYTLYISNTDHRYRIAQYDGSRWIDREVARAGGCLYDRESSYTGLIALDPLDPSTVVISTDVDPKTGVSSDGKHEIYRAKVGINDDVETIRWESVTRDSRMRNIRPVIVRDQDTRVIAWLRGTFNTYTDYRLDVVGIVEDVR